MARSKFQTMWEEAERKVRAYERIRENAATEEFLRVALSIINKHGLSQEFVDALLSKPKPE